MCCPELGLKVSSRDNRLTFGEIDFKPSHLLKAHKKKFEIQDFPRRVFNKYERVISILEVRNSSRDNALGHPRDMARGLSATKDSSQSIS